MYKLQRLQSSLRTALFLESRETRTAPRFSAVTVDVRLSARLEGGGNSRDKELRLCR